MNSVTPLAEATADSQQQYFATRFARDSRREIVWRALNRYFFQHMIRSTGCVLELGCGYGHFINNVVARRRVALDLWDGFTSYMDPEVETHVGEVTDLSFLDSGSVDFVFASNLFEHVSQASLASVLNQLRSILRPDGTITFLQPNYRYASKEYFDDYTHTTIYSHVSLCDFLEANGYRVTLAKPRFLPFSMKSSRFVSPLLIRLYLLSPWKPGGKQMLIQATPVR